MEINHTLTLNIHNSIGVEVVGRYDKKSKAWEPLTSGQVESTAQAVHQIMDEYSIDTKNIIPHEKASIKTSGEGGTVLNAIKPRLKELINKKQPQSNQP